MNAQCSDAMIDTLLSHLRVGKNNAISRDKLAMEMQMSDRAVRNLIEKARNEGWFIMNSQDGSGYYLSSDIEDIARQYRQDTNRALAILKRRKHMRRVLKEAGIRI